MHKLPATDRTVLLGAAELIRKRGWTRLHETAPDGRVCLVGAIKHAAMADVRSLRR